MKLRIALLAALSMLATPLFPVIAVHAAGERLARLRLAAKRGAYFTFLNDVVFPSGLAVSNSFSVIFLIVIL